MRNEKLKVPLGLLAWRRWSWLKPELVNPVPQPIPVSSRDELYEKIREIMKEQMEKNGLRCTLFSYITQKYEESGAEPGMYSHPHGTEECSCDEIMEWINRIRQRHNDEFNAVRMRFEPSEITEETVPNWFIIVLN